MWRHTHTSQGPDSWQNDITSYITWLGEFWERAWRHKHLDSGNVQDSSKLTVCRSALLLWSALGADALKNLVMQQVTSPLPCLDTCLSWTDKRNSCARPRTWRKAGFPCSRSATWRPGANCITWYIVLDFINKAVITWCNSHGHTLSRQSCASPKYRRSLVSLMFDIIKVANVMQMWQL